MKSYNGFEPRQRLRALAWLKQQYAQGTRTRPIECDACGQTEGIIERHSEDYSEPFGDHIGAYGLCFTCHMFVHCRFRSPAAWLAYCEAVAEGATFPPFHIRNFPMFSSLFLRLPLPETRTFRAAPQRRALDEIEAHGTSRATAQADGAPRA